MKKKISNLIELNNDTQTHLFDGAAFWAKTKIRLLVAMLPGFAVSLFIIYRWISMYNIKAARGISLGEQLFELFVFLLLIFLFLQLGCLIVFFSVKKARRCNCFFTESGIPVWRKSSTNLGDEHDPDFIIRDYRIKRIKSLSKKSNGTIIVQGEIDSVELHNDGEPKKTVINDKLVDDIKTRKRITIPPYYQKMDVIWNILTTHYQKVDPEKNIISAKSNCCKEDKTASIDSKQNQQEEEIDALIAAAAKQDPEAMFKIGLLYYVGNESSALQKLGDYYYGGKDVRQDYARAFEWFADAADAGHSKAALYAGKMLQDKGGSVIKGKKGQARAYLTMAANAGDEEARIILGQNE